MERPLVSLAVALSARSNAAPAPLPAPAPLSPAEVEEFVRRYVAATNEADAAKLVGMVSQAGAVSSVGLGKISRGWEAIQKATRDATASGARFKVAMGTIQVTLLGPDSALAVAAMTLSPTQPLQAGRSVVMRDAPGAATIVVGRFPEGLRLIHEHYSLRPDKA